MTGVRRRLWDRIAVGPLGGVALAVLIAYQQREQNRAARRRTAAHVADHVATRVYGDDTDGRNTIHATNTIDVDVLDGRVVAVWFRCQQLRFTQRDLEIDQTHPDNFDLPKLVAVELID